MTDSWWTSTERVSVPAGRVARGAVRLPGSKSMTLRAYALALLAREPVRVEGALEAEDAGRFRAALGVLGCGVRREADAVVVEPPSAASGGGRIDCGDAGTLFRFLLALTATRPGRWELDGSPRLRERPAGALIGALRSLGARIEELGAPGFAPVAVSGGRLGGGRVRLDARESSQFLSALLLAGQAAAAPLEIEVEHLVSGPYAELTAAMIRERGGRVGRPEPALWVASPGPLDGGTIRVEGDLSSAAYPAAAAALTRGEVDLIGCPLASRQADARFLRLLGEMGADVVEGPLGCRVGGGAVLHALDADLSELPDQVPTLAALAPFARGTTRIRNVAHLRLKESDRLAAMAAELRRAGAEAEELPDGLVVPGLWAVRRPPREPVEVDPHGDHRIAMAMALLGLRRDGLSVREPGVVAKSWPGFWRALAGLVEPAAAEAG